MFFRYLLAALAFTLATGGAGAVPLAPGGVIFPTGTTSAGPPNLAGVVQNDNLIPFAIDPNPATPFTNVGGNVQNSAVRANGSGTMIFGPRIRDTFNIATLRFEIVAFSLTGYGGFATDVDFRTDGLGDVGPDSVSRSVDGNTMTFRYSGDPLSIDGLAPGLQEESLFPSIYTDAPAYTLDGRMTIFGYDAGDPGNLLSVEIGGLAVPAPAPVPVPATAALLLGGLFGLGLMGRRKS